MVLSGGFARAVVRYRGRVALAWLVAVVALVPQARRADQAFDVAARVHGSESAAVEHLLASRFGSAFAYRSLLVLTGAPSPDEAAGRRLLVQVITALDTLSAVAGTVSYLDTPDTLFLGTLQRGTLIVVGLDPGGRPVDALIPELRRATQATTARLRPEFPDLELRWTGEVALNFDLRRTSASESQAAERRTMPLTLMLLVWAFGALAAAFLPVLAGMLAIALAIGCAVVLATYWPVSMLLQNVVSMLGLGLGIDYALLMISRFRESLARGCTAEDAAVEAVRQAGHTIAISGAAVAIGFAALLWVPLNELRSVAIGGLLVVVWSVLLATTLLPGLLAWAGRRVDLGRFGRGLGGRKSAEERWRRWGRWVVAHPRRTLLVAAPPVVFLALQALRTDTELPRGDWLPPTIESARGLHDLQAMGRGGVVQAVRVVLELPGGLRMLDPRGWDAAQKLRGALVSDRRVAQVREFRSEDRRAVLFEVVPREDVEPNDVMRFVRELRGQDAAGLTGLAGSRLLVGGLPAFNVDYETAISGRFPRVVALVVGGTLLALFVGFRSVLVPLKAVLLNLLSVAAAFGAVVLVFQDGHGVRWVGLPQAMGGVFPAVPILVFCTVFGLSIDYEVFLVGRIAEARRRGLDESEALVEGLARTGSVITNAALIMIAVFASFMLGAFLLVKMLGFALAVAVFLDATIVRVAIGPALLRLCGRFNWWPGRRDARAAEVRYASEVVASE